MKTQTKLATLLSLLVCLSLAQFASAATVAPPAGSEYALTLDDTKTYSYDVKNFGGVTTWWGVGDWETATGGKIEVVFTNYADKPAGSFASNPDPVPYLTLTVKDTVGGSLVDNLTVTDQANTAVSSALTLGWGGYELGFLSVTNWTSVEASLNDVATTAWGAVATITVTVGSSEVSVTIEQTAGFGDQETHLRYDKNTGVLTYANTTFGAYWLEFELPSADIPGFTWILPVSVLGVLVAVAIVSRRTRRV